MSPETAHLQWKQRWDLEVRANGCGPVCRLRRWAFIAWSLMLAVMVMFAIIRVIDKQFASAFSLNSLIIDTSFMVATISLMLSLMQGCAQRQALRRLMLEEGLRPARCFDCKYNLRGTELNTCPECGAVLMIGSDPDEAAEKTS